MPDCNDVCQKGEEMKRGILISALSVMVAVAITGATARSLQSRSGAEQAPPHSGDGWEYLVVSGGNVNLTPSDGGTMRKEPGAFGRESFPLERNLDKLGAKGWELVAVTGSAGDPTFYLKRKK
jgi:hypothetical protein